MSKFVGPTRWLVIKMRETGELRVIGTTSVQTIETTPWSPTKRRKKTYESYYAKSVYPKPEHASPFVESHQVIAAESAEEALTKWQTN